MWSALGPLGTLDASFHSTLPLPHWDIWHMVPFEKSQNRVLITGDAAHYFFFFQKKGINVKEAVTDRI